MNEATTETTAATTATKKKSKKPAKSKASPKATAPKAAKPKVAKPPRESREGWGTFALRLPIEERAAFHKATGAAGASRFARTILVAFSNDDEAAFKNAIAEARKLRTP